MQANTLVVNDGTSDRSFDLVSRQGMESTRREVGVSSTLASQLKIANTVDLNNLAAKNKHLIQFGWNEVDATTGAVSKAAIWIAISRDKAVTDASIAERSAMLADLVAQPGFLTDILVGGN